MSRNKSIFRQPGAQHFQVLHRSLRDPLTNDENASSHVLASMPRRGQKSQAVVQEEVEHGIGYEDDYDYLQHLRTIGTEREAVFVTADKTQQKKSQRDEQQSQLTHTQDGIALPPEALPSKEERDYAEMLGIPDRPFGLQPAMDPKLREVLEALEDDAYVGAKQEDDEDFFESLMGDDDDVAEGDEYAASEEEEDQRTGWEKHMDQFKVPAPVGTASDSEEELDSEAGDTVAELRQTSASRRPARGAVSAQGSAFSMSSSAMFRNEGLRTLDDRFDQLEREYESDSDEFSEEDSDEEPVDLGEKRPDLAGILDDFLSRYKTLGAQPVDGQASEGGRYAQLEELRQELRAVTLGDGSDSNKDYILKRAAELDAIEEKGKHERTQTVAMEPPAGEQDRWDCQTILSTRSNLENHPKMIRLRDVSAKAKKHQQQQDLPHKIVLDPKTGFPCIAPPSSSQDPSKADSDEASTSQTGSEPGDNDELGQRLPHTVTRSKTESKEDKKARKASVKAERASRRVEKKGNKDAFGAELARQKGLNARANKADRQVGQKGVVGLS